MPEFKVTINDPTIGAKIKVHIERTKGFKYLGLDLDQSEHRFVLAFFTEDPEAATDTHELTYDIIINDDGELHSISAVAIVDNMVVGQDRKRVMSGQLQG